MKPLSLRINNQHIIKTIYRFAKKRKIKLYLVGGYIRDILLKKEKDNPDFDFCLKKDAIRFGKALAKKLKAGFVVLDKEHGCCRLVKRINPVRDLKVTEKRCDVSNGVKDKVYTLDFTDFRGKDIEKDLLHRDFTINALALELEKIFNKENLNNFIIDPYKGKADLKTGLIRQVNKKGFDEDPLRILRAFSMAAIFNFKIDNETLKWIKIKKAKLNNISQERIRDELFKILNHPLSFNYLLEMERLKILKIIFPEIEMMRGVYQGPYHHLDVFKHTLETLRQLDNLIGEVGNNKEIRDYLNEVISGDRKRRSLLKLGALLHDIGKPKARRRENGKTKFHGHEKIGLQISEEIARRLRLSNDEIDSLKKMVMWHLRPGYLADNEEITPRATFRYFRDTAKECVSTLLLSLADQRATKGPLTSRESRMRHEEVVKGLIREYFRNKRKKKLPRLITGDDLINKFKLEPSPLIGKVLREIEESQAIGKIKTKKEALKKASEFIRASQKCRP